MPTLLQLRSLDKSGHIRSHETLSDEDHTRNWKVLLLTIRKQSIIQLYTSADDHQGSAEVHMPFKYTCDGSDADVVRIATELSPLLDCFLVRIILTPQGIRKRARE